MCTSGCLPLGFGKSDINENLSILDMFTKINDDFM